MNIGVIYLFELVFLFPSDIYPGVEKGSFGSSIFFLFFSNYHCFP